MRRLLPLSLSLRMALFAAVATLPLSRPLLADEGGGSLYLPGSFASMAAVPGAPGWSTDLTYYHASSGARNVSERADLAYGGVAYTFATPVLGGQLALGMVGAFGRMSVTMAGVSRDARLGVMDVTPTASLRWNTGVHNFLAYTMVNIPTGTYNRSRLANFGLNHWGQDAGVGYTYFDKDTGYEFSVVAGATYNGENKATRYRNGFDTHIDFGASKLFSNTYQLGLAGYYYQQTGADRGQGAGPGNNKSRVIALGPQIGYLFPAGGAQGAINLRAYREFAAANRPAGWNVWLTLSFSPAGP